MSRRHGTLERCTKTLTNSGALKRFIGVCCLLFGINAGEAVADKAPACATVRGINPRAVAFTFDVDGGQMPRGAESPLLSVSTEGVATIRPARIGKRAHRMQLSAQAHCTHVRMLLDDFNVLAIDAQAIRAAIAHASGRARVADASTTSLRITGAGAEHDISIYALRLMAHQHPAIEPLQRFEHAAQYLTSVAEQLRAQSVDQGTNQIGARP